MVEGGVVKAGETEYLECWQTTWKTPYIMRLALSAGLGGLLFGYDTGVISGAMLYIKEDFESVEKNTWLQETIVSMAVGGAIFGAAIGGWMNDKLGRKKSILVADFVFFVGAIVMALAPAPWVIIIGRLIVGFGVGMASMTSPLYISEASPARIRGALVSTNGLLITGGQFFAYLINLGLSRVNGTWRVMLGIAAVPAALQFGLMWFLPESPRWLYRRDRREEARVIMEKIYPAEQVDEEMRVLHESVEAEKAEGAIGNGGIIAKLGGAWNNPVVRRGLYAGIIVQVGQQFCGINTVMYYSPTIVQFAGFASNTTAMALSLITSFLNAAGSIVSMLFVDRFGRRRLMLVSMTGIIVWLVVLAGVFFQSASHAPAINSFESINFGGNSTCAAYVSAHDTSKWNCMSCLRHQCGFCAHEAKEFQPGACLDLRKDVRGACHANHRVWFTEGCPSRIGMLAVLVMALYIITYAPGMGTVPWVLNSEIYPLRYRGTGGGIAAVSNWVSNLVVSQSFLSLVKALGAGGTFLLFAGFSFLGLIGIYFLVPETKGLLFEEVEELLKSGKKHKKKNTKNQKEVSDR